MSGPSDRAPMWHYEYSEAWPEWKNGDAPYFPHEPEMFEAQWSNGYGTDALRLWIGYLFDHLDTIARVGLTTWSGNVRMICCAEKLGMQMEGRIRKVWYWQGEYYDTIRMGVLREEWGALHG